MDENIQKLKRIADQIIEKNPGMLISGSLALNLCGIKTRRPASDVDLYLPYNQQFQKVDGLEYGHVKSEDDYDDEWYERVGYLFGNVPVDVFTPLGPEADITIFDEQRSDCLARHVIIGFKISHSFGRSHTKYKHKDDVISILVNN